MDGSGKLEFLNKYTLDKNLCVNLLHADEVSRLKEGLVPDEWKEIFITEDKSGKIKKLLTIRESFVGKEMSNTIS